ncbi:MAG: hypothetical protein D3909_07285 [Candidatus Electrothrix sp. ATG1]|nr:hypothetical protein [Candidatus Electrothrix sp. ATG1]
MPMKRFLLVFVSFLALYLAVHLLVFQTEKDKEPLEKNTQEAVRLRHKRSLISAGKDFFSTPFARRLASIDRTTLPKLFAKAIEQQLQYHGRVTAPQELIPGHAMAVLELTNAAATGKGFLDSRFGQTLNKIKWPVILQRLKIKRRFRQPLEQSASTLMDLLTHPSFSQTFDGPIFFAQLPARPSLIQGNQRHPFLSNLLIIMDPGPKNSDTVLTALLDILQGKQTRLNYAGLTVHALKLKTRQQLYIASVGGKIILAFAQQPIRESIVLFLNQLFAQRNDLLLKQEYTVLRKKAPEKTDFFLYADLFRLKLHLKLLLTQRDSQSKEQQTITRPWVPGVRSMGFYHYSEEKTEQLRTIVRFSQDQLHPFQKHIYTTPPVLSQSFQEVPEDLLLSFWFNWLEPRLWWQTTVAHSNKDELAAADRIAAWVQAKTDMTMEQFLGLFGKDFSVHVADISTAGFFPVPRLCFRIEILDKKKVDKFLQAIIADLPVKHTMVS